jgi:hypothetical protein
VVTSPIDGCYSGRLEHCQDAAQQANGAVARKAQDARGSFATLDSRIATTRKDSEIGRGEARALGNSRQHPWPDFFVIVKSENEIRPTAPFECSM